MAGMFTGATNVNITGGSFQTINGSYYHHEYNTQQQNVDVNNVRDNHYEEVYNDESQTNHGGRCTTKTGRTRQRTAYPAPTDQQPAQRRQSNKPYPSTKPRQALPSRSYTSPTIRDLTGYDPAGPSPALLGRGTSVLLKEGDVQGLEPQAAPYLKAFFAAQFPEQNNQAPRARVGEDANTRFGGGGEKDPDTDDEEPSLRMRMPSPPTGRLSQLSLGNPSVYAPQSPPQGTLHPPYAPPYTSLHTPPPSAISTPSERIPSFHAPAQPVLSQAYDHRYQPQRHQLSRAPLTPPATPMAAPAMPNPMDSPQATQPRTRRARKPRTAPAPSHVLSVANTSTSTSTSFSTSWGNPSIVYDLTGPSSDEDSDSTGVDKD